jgi:cell division protein FtsQ
MKKAIMILRWLLVIVLFVLVLSFTNGKHQQQLVSLDEINIELAEERFVNHEIVIDFMLEKGISFDSVSLNQFQLEELEQFLEYHPSIKNVEVFTTQEGDISIDIIQRKAVVRIITKNDNYYLDANGNVMPISKYYTPRVLVVSGNVSEQNHQEIFFFVNIINESEFWKAQITQLHFIDNDVILIPRVGEQKIYFGFLTSVKEKLDNLYQFYQQVIHVKGWQTYSDISLKYNNQIVCTKK